MIQRLRFHASIARSEGSIPDWGTRTLQAVRHSPKIQPNEQQMKRYYLNNKEMSCQENLKCMFLSEKGRSEKADSHVYVSSSTTIWERQSYTASKNSGWGLGEAGRNRKVFRE